MYPAVQPPFWSEEEYKERRRGGRWEKEDNVLFSTPAWALSFKFVFWTRWKKKVLFPKIPIFKLPRKVLEQISLINET